MYNDPIKRKDCSFCKVRSPQTKKIRFKISLNRWKKWYSSWRVSKTVDRFCLVTKTVCKYCIEDLKEAKISFEEVNND